MQTTHVRTHEGEKRPLFHGLFRAFRNGASFCLAGYRMERNLLAPTENLTTRTNEREYGLRVS